MSLRNYFDHFSRDEITITSKKPFLEIFGAAEKEVSCNLISISRFVTRTRICSSCFREGEFLSCSGCHHFVWGIQIQIQISIQTNTVWMNTNVATANAELYVCICLGLCCHHFAAFAWVGEPLTPPPGPLSKLQLSTQGKLQLSLKTTKNTNFSFRGRSRWNISSGENRSKWMEILIQFWLSR